MATAALAATLLVGPGAGVSAADPAVPPTDGVFTLSGKGYGHGIGMSQYGAYGGAGLGKTWQQIVGFYYPGTTVFTQSTARTIRVRITADNDADLQVYPSAGLQLRDRVTGATYRLPTGPSYPRWRVRATATGYVLHYRKPTGTWVQRTPTLRATSVWTFENTAKIVKIRIPGGTRQELRSQVYLVRTPSGPVTVNRLRVESYLRSVVPSEMPTSWPAHAVRSQAVAARTYAARLQGAAAPRAVYDTCDTVQCQVYKGYASTRDGVRSLYETTAGTSAVSYTAGRILLYAGAPALTMFSSSNGGHSAAGTPPYLVARADSWDGRPRSQAWTATLTTARVAQVYPGIGTVRQLQVLTRDGFGSFGGRVTSIRVVGSLDTRTVTGPEFRLAFGLRSALFTLV
jgi:stage II sporulation protein D